MIPSPKVNNTRPGAPLADTHTSSCGRPPLLFPFLVFGLLFLTTDFLRPYAVPDEARYVGIAMEMARTNDFVTPYLNGIKYFEKPPLFYWLQGVLFKLSSLAHIPYTPLLGRLGVGLFALGGVLVVYCGLWFLMPSLSNQHRRRLSWRGAWITASSLLYFVMARLVTLDMGLSFTMSACLMAFLVAFHQPPGIKRRGALYVATLGAGLAVLAKGLIGILMPGLIIATWLTLTLGWKRLFPLYLPTCLLLLALIVAPWHLAIMHRHPEFGWFYFVHEHFLRYTTTIHRRNGPGWMGVAVLTLGLLPWMWSFWWRAVGWMGSFTDAHGIRGAAKYVADAFSKNASKNPISLFFMVWFGWILLFFTLSSSKLIPYFLPAIPAAACWLALQWEIPPSRASHSPQRSLMLDYAGQVGTFTLLTLIALAMGASTALNGGKTPTQTLSLLALALLLGVITVMYVLWLKRCASINPKTATRGMPPAQLDASHNAFFIRTTVVGVIINLSLTLVGSPFQRPSVQDAANFVRRLNPHEVYQLGFFYYDFPVYYGRPTPVMTGALGELAYGLHHTKNPQMLLSYTDLGHRWQRGVDEGTTQCGVLQTELYTSCKGLYPHTLYKNFGHYSVLCSGPIQGDTAPGGASTLSPHTKSQI